MRSITPWLVAVIALALGTPAWAQLAVPDDAGIVYGHVHFNVSDIDEHERIWVEHFDATPFRRGRLRGVWTPGTLIAFTEQTPTGGSQGSVMDHYGVKVRNTEAWLERWKAAGYTVDSEFTGAEGHHNAYVTLPDGVRVELQEDQMLPVDVEAYHVHWFTPQFDEVLDWYGEMFGLERLPRGRIETTANVPGMNLSFGNTQGEHAPSEGRAIDHVGFEVDDLRAVVESLKAKGVTLDRDYTELDELGLKVAFLTDPSGVRVELTEGLDAYEGAR